MMVAYFVRLLNGAPEYISIYPYEKKEENYVANVLSLLASADNILVLHFGL